jgi:NAD(P)H-dependent FMN reductase
MRPIMAQLKIADIGEQVMLSIFTDFKDGVFQPDPRHEKSLSNLVDQLIAWSTALKPLRK